MQKSRSELEKLLYAFLAAGSQPDLARLMEFFAEDAILEASNGSRHEGADAIAEFFRPVAEGELGQVRYDAVDFFCEVESQKVMISWNFHTDVGGDEVIREGIDILVFDEGRIVKKIAHTKAEKPVLIRPGERAQGAHANSGVIETG